MAALTHSAAPTSLCAPLGEWLELLGFEVSRHEVPGYLSATWRQAGGGSYYLEHDNLGGDDVLTLWVQYQNCGPVRLLFSAQYVPSLPDARQQLLRNAHFRQAYQAAHPAFDFTSFT